MRILSYNIFEGGRNGLDKIIRIINTYSPDILLLQEANSFLDNDGSVARDFSVSINMPFYEIAKSGEYDYHVATFAKVPFKSVQKIEHFRNAALAVYIVTDQGEMVIFNTHLSPYKEDDRIKEIDQLLEVAKQNGNVVVAGDFNSLSIDDNYPVDIVENFNERQINKFTTEGQLRFDVMSTLRASGMIDCGNDKKIPTAPTKANKDPEHESVQLRLDYIFVSESLKTRVKDFQVLKTTETDQASDHYPLLLNLL